MEAVLFVPPTGTMECCVAVTVLLVDRGSYTRISQQGSYIAGCSNSYVTHERGPSTVIVHGGISAAV